MIDTPRCRIRPAQPEDLAALEEAVSDPAFPADLPLARMHRAGELKAWLEKCCRHDGEPRLRSLTLLASPACIGQIGLFPEGRPGTYWLSYWLAPAVQGQGLASECIRALLDRHAQPGGCKRVVAAAAPGNARSLALLRRLGFLPADELPPRTVIPPDHPCLTLDLLPAAGPRQHGRAAKLSRPAQGHHRPGAL
ncbi:GNAT family N-acetyltransferase [Uliginosibacterium paludis]|uniref:GNAT family N-acetyltransferase n=1 Tax=Uliginosibacterium paludis TaxID=1615952 RepID=A0ABV2CP52_9RHOO